MAGLTGSVLLPLQNNMSCFRLQIWKTLDTAERTLIGMIDLVDCDVDVLFSANGPASFSEERRLNESINGSPAPSTPIAKVPETAVIKKKADKTETEQFYLSVSVLDLSPGSDL